MTILVHESILNITVFIQCYSDIVLWSSHEDNLGTTSFMFCSLFVTFLFCAREQQKRRKKNNPRSNRIEKVSEKERGRERERERGRDERQMKTIFLTARFGK